MQFAVFSEKFLLDLNFAKILRLLILEEEVVVENDEHLEIDTESDRDLNHPLVGRRIKGLYDNGWFKGQICWYNTKMNKLRILFEDDTDDYIIPDDIDGIELIFIEEGN